MDALISICMPYFQRQAMLDKSLAIYRKFYPGAEISICDDGSPDPVIAPGCRVVTLPAKPIALNPCVAINAAVKNATRDVIVLTNPEVEHKAPILVEMLASLREGGPMTYVTASCWDVRGRWVAHSTLDGGRDNRGMMPKGAQFHHCAMFTRELWESAGGFDEDYRAGSHFDDNDFLMRLQRAGAKFTHRDDLVTRHSPTFTRWPEGGWQRNEKIFRGKWCLESLSA